MSNNSDISNNNEFELVNLNDNGKSKFCKKSLLDYDLVKDMLGLASLVYNFNIDIKAEVCNNTKKFDLNK